MENNFKVSISGDDYNSNTISSITEEAKETPVIKTVMFLVEEVIAGIAAALAAARNGAKVILIEKQCALGGLATLGL